MATVTPRVSMTQGIRPDGNGDPLGAMRATAGHDGNGDPPGTWVEDGRPRLMAKLLDNPRALHPIWFSARTPQSLGPNSDLIWDLVAFDGATVRRHDVAAIPWSTL